ncbi:restriction endonuclease subunit R, partial [Okeania sp. SIO2G5]|uniref:restriction endonuclease subunit R n=1 Tax=Okeania sp. SIO2G5 TaxID=2607796 RepID=UPI0013C23A15
LQARDISLDELHTQFGLQSTADKTFFPEWQEATPGLSDFEQTQLRRVQKNYLNLASRKNFSEEAVKMVVLSPLLDLAGFYQAPFALQTEESVEIKAEDSDLLVKGKIDVLVVQQKFWVLVIESKSTQFDVLTALPQALTYMLGNPQANQPIYGLLVNGREFVFIKLMNANEANSNLTYARSYALSLEHNGDLNQVLETLKVIRSNILEPTS